MALQSRSFRSSDCTTALAVGKNIYDPLIFSPKLIKFTRKEYLFLNAYRLGTPLEEAARKAELSASHAECFLRRDATVAWLRDRALKDHIKAEWEEPGKWWALGDAVLSGKKRFNKSQVVVYQEFGARVVPKPRAEDVRPLQQTVNFNFSAQSVQNAFKRQAAIDAEVGEPA